MMNKSLSCIAVFACFLMQADALSFGMMEEEGLDFLADPLVETQKEIDAENPNEEVNVTGAWSIDLLSRPQEKMKLYLLQNNSTISGQGVIIAGDKTENVTANGLIIGAKMNLTVVPAGVPDLYKLNLSLSSLLGGEYTVHQADGGSRSGKFTFSVSSNIFKTASAADEWNI